MISRRAFVAGGIALLAWPRAGRAGSPVAPAADQRALFEGSEFAYVSPLRTDGAESTCHGEVWFAWLDGAALTTSSAESWKARALGQGLDRARLWFGSHGRWKQGFGKNEAFRSGPGFEARASRVEDAATLERILAVYEDKYPDEIARWRDRMRAEVASGKRVILRYQPLGA